MARLTDVNQVQKVPAPPLATITTDDSQLFMTDCLRPITNCSHCTFGTHTPERDCDLKMAAHPAGTVLLRQGQTLDRLYFVRSGMILLSAWDAEGTERLCRLRSVGAIVGWGALLTGKAEYSVTTLSPVQLCGLNINQPHSLPRDHQLLRSLLSLAAAEIARADQENWLLRGSAASRLARLLLERQRANLASYPLTIERRLLARVLGIRPETLCRAERKLRERGVVTDDRNLFILDPDQLDQIADEAMKL